MTWSAPFRVPPPARTGRLVRGGRLLYPGKQLWEGGRNGVAASDDDGRTWRWLSDIPTRPGDRFEEYHELHGVEAADGRIIVHIRNHNRASVGETLQCESSDVGKTWSAPHSIGVWTPSHLLRLKDGPRDDVRTPAKPFGNQARVSRDHGRTGGADRLSTTGSEDLGYLPPSNSSGGLLTVWYERQGFADGGVACIALVAKALREPASSDERGFHGPPPMYNPKWH
jgi:hypothetical protein